MMQRSKRYIPVLTIAGSDSGGGAGVQADLKTFSALGCYGTSVITATTAQNTMGVKSIHDIPVEHIVDQFNAVISDISPLAIKIGMLRNPEVVVRLAEELRKYPQIPIVFDPVMVATSGDSLIKEETIALLKRELFPISHLITPNLDEVAALIGRPVEGKEGMIQAAAALLEYQSAHVLVKGGHLKGGVVVDVLKGKGVCEVFEGEKIHTVNAHGTGCTLSSAIAAFLARGENVKEAVNAAREYVRGALSAGKDVFTGQGHGPLNHFYQPENLIKKALD